MYRIRARQKFLDRFKNRIAALPATRYAVAATAWNNLPTTQQAQFTALQLQ